MIKLTEAQTIFKNATNFIKKDGGLLSYVRIEDSNLVATEAHVLYLQKLDGQFKDGAISRDNALEYGRGKVDYPKYTEQKINNFDYKRLFPTDYFFSTVLPVGKLCSLLTGFKQFLKSLDLSDVVKLSFEPLNKRTSLLTIFSVTDDFIKVQIRLKTNNLKENYWIAVDLARLIACLKVFENQTIKISFQKNNLRPIFFESKHGERQALLMPMRLLKK